MAIGPALARLRTAGWFGWQVEGNWADPVLFGIYIVARPLAVAAILVAMYRSVQGSAAHSALFAGFYIANAFHAYADRMIIGLGWVIFEEREEYETLKYICLSPMGLLVYLVGRSSVKFTLASVSVALTLGLGWFLLGVRWDWGAVQWWPLLASLVLGLLAALFSGLLVAGLGLVITRAAVVAFEGIALGLYLLCGVIFPIELLPLPLRIVSYALPFTWWYEALRRFLLGHGSSASLGRLGDGQLVGVLALVTAVFGVLAVWGFRAFEDRARRIGRLDQTTLY